MRVNMYTPWHPQVKSSGDKTEEDAKLAKQRLAAMEMRQRYIYIHVCVYMRTIDISG